MFLSPLILEAQKAPGKWLVRAPLIWVCPNFGRLAVPSGLETDLASIPQLVQVIPAFDACGLSRRPAVLHDYLYQSGDLTRMDADQVFHDALVAEGVSEVAARIYYRAVRVAGRIPWERHRAS